MQCIFCVNKSNAVEYLAYNRTDWPFAVRVALCPSHLSSLKETVRKVLQELLLVESARMHLNLDSRVFCTHCPYTAHTPDLATWELKFTHEQFPAGVYIHLCNSHATGTELQQIKSILTTVGFSMTSAGRIHQR